MAIEVVAKRPGFYLKLRAKGDRFAVSNRADLGRWMEVIPPPADPANKPDDKAVKKAKA